AAAASMTQSIVARSKDGWEWEKVSVIGAPNYWLWRITWHQKKAYGVAYATGPAVNASGDHHSMLFSSRNGSEFEVMIPDFRASRSPRPTEATLRFDKAGNMICLHRRDGEKPTALLGFSPPPYVDFDWRDLGAYLGGPNFIQLPSGQWVACGRMKNVGPKKETKTVLCQLYLDAGTLEPLLVLPSGGDSSYPGLQWHQGKLWVSYYSSHESKAAIYLAKVALN
ncbi:MAG: exo-alpha-sialidase, partial [Limisphaerales bacterium]